MAQASRLCLENFSAKQEIICLITELIYVVNYVVNYVDNIDEICVNKEIQTVNKINFCYNSA